MVDELDEGLAEHGDEIEVFVDVLFVDDGQDDVECGDEGGVVVGCDGEGLGYLEYFQRHSIHRHRQANLIHNTELHPRLYPHRQYMIDNLHRIICQYYKLLPIHHLDICRTGVITIEQCFELN